MNCDDVRKYEYTYLDGEFDRRDCTEFEAHLAACAPCRTQVTQSARFRDGLRRHLRCDEAPEGLRARVCAGLDSVETPTSMQWTAFAVPVALAAGFSLAVVGWQQFAPQPSALPGTAMAQLGATVVPTTTAVAGVTGVAKRGGVLRGTRGSDPKRVAQHRPAMRVTRSLSNDMEYCESEKRRAPRGAVRQVGHVGPTEVIGGGVGEDFLAREGRYGAVRTRSNLRALVSSHVRPLPAEVAGGADKIRAWLQRSAPGHSALPIAEGAGVKLLGARLGHLGAHRVVSFRYQAFDKPVTVVRYLPSRGLDLADDSHGPKDDAPPSGAVRDLVAGYSVVHTARDGEVLSIVSELDHQALLGIIEPPTFL